MKEEQGYDSESYASPYMPTKTIYQSDARLFHRGGYTYDTVSDVVSVRVDEGVLTAELMLRLGRPANLRVFAVAPGILRLQFWQGEDSFDVHSAMLVQAVEPLPALTLGESDEGYIVTWAGCALRLGRNPFRLEGLGDDGRIRLELETEKIAGEFVTPPLGFRRRGADAEPYLSWRMQNDERFFGLGEKWNKVEKTSTRATVWASDTCGSNTTDMSYKSLPVLFSTAGWGLMLHSSYRSFWEVGTFSYISGSVLTEDPKLDLFFFFGPTLKDLLGLYTWLTGRPSLPPRWAMGIWMSRCMYQNRAEVESVLARLREEQIPCDVVHLDPAWMRTHYYYKLGVDACDFEWNSEAWPDRAGMLRDWLEQGFNTCFWVNPYLPEGTPIYEEAKAAGYLLTTTRGEVARLEHGEPVGTVDFSNPAAKAWWKAHLKALVAEGASVFKPDYGDRVSEEAVFWNGRSGREMHNLFMALYTEAAFEAAAEARGEGMVWRRSGYIGSQRYPGTWAGDTQVSWQGMRGCLRGGLSAGLTGEAFWSHDIGGFVGPQPSPELYIRWAQFGMFSPLTRFHGTSPREPWEYGSQALAVVRHYAQLRYALMPYLLSAAQESVETGLPMLRHMRLEFPDEPNADTLDDQYALGGDLLVAPVLSPGQTARHVYFPQGRWWALEDVSYSVEGPGFAEVEAPLERIPVFVRAGAVIPRYVHLPQHLKEPAPAEMELSIYPGASRRSLRCVEDSFVLGIDYAFGETPRPDMLEGGASDGDTSRSWGRLVLQPAPLTLTVWLMDFRAVQVISTGAPISWEVFERDTLLTLDIQDGATVLFC